MIAALYDIHGNLPALEAVASELNDLPIDRIIIGGDVLPGPMPLECLKLISSFRAPVDYITGNGELSVIDASKGALSSKLPPNVQKAIQWNADLLSAGDIDALEQWPQTLSQMNTSAGDIFFCHATPLNPFDIFTKLTPESELLDMFEQVNEPTIICGHTHMQFERRIGSKRVINAGSVGMPFGAPGADWLLIGDDFELKHTDYDLDLAAQVVSKTEYPDAREFAKNNILDPPTETHMLNIFTLS